MQKSDCVATFPARLVLQRKCACGTHTAAGAECDNCRARRGDVLRRSTQGADAGVAPVVHDVLRFPGRPLDPAALAFMEPRFGFDFSRVRVHTDAKAAESARAVEARAYTVGEQVVFGGGEYAPSSVKGRGLLAHELTHVVQHVRSNGPTALHPEGLRVAERGDASEREADDQAGRLLGETTDRSPALVSSSAEPAIRRAVTDAGTDVEAVDDGGSGGGGSTEAGTPDTTLCTDARGATHPPGTDLSEFRREGSELLPQHDAIVAQFAKDRASDNDPGRVIEVHGYASADGPEDYNFSLSCRRAKAVSDRLGELGVSGTIKLYAHGETTEFGPGLPANRRVVIATTAPAKPSPTPAPQPEPEPPSGGNSGPQKECVKRLGGCPETRPGGIPSPEELKQYNDDCRKETGYDGPDVTPDCQPVPVPPEPVFVCGPDVTSQVAAALSRTRSHFAGLPSDDARTDTCHALNSLISGGYAWDIVELHNNDWIHLNYRPACATEGATPPCGSSVQVGDDCYYAGSVNYVVFGVMCQLCNAHLAAIGAPDASDFNKAGMLDLIDKYKGHGFTGLQTPSDNFVPSQQWASAGFDGWPSGASAPKGDRSNCKPTCPTAYAGARFTVHWVPDRNPLHALDGLF
jgi:outer membrane protein OmpA-like peptidoglycan-associated protein